MWIGYMGQGLRGEFIDYCDGGGVVTRRVDEREGDGETKGAGAEDKNGGRWWWWCGGRFGIWSHGGRFLELVDFEGKRGKWRK